MIYLRQKFSEDKRCTSYAWGKVLHYWTYIGNTNFIGDKSSQVHLYEDKQILFEEKWVKNGFLSAKQALHSVISVTDLREILERS